MRILSCAVAALVLLGGQAQAKPIDPMEIGGRWKAPGGSCDDWVLHANEFNFTSKGEEALFGVIQVGSDWVRGNIPLDGPDKGKLIWEDTMKPAAKVAPSGGKVKLSVLDKASGVKAATLEPCPGTAPNYNKYRALLNQVWGAWYEVTDKGEPVASSGGKDSCTATGADPNQRGAMAFTWSQGTPSRRMMFSRGGLFGHNKWVNLDAQPVVHAGDTWLSLDIGTDGKPRYVNFNPNGGYPMYVTDPQTKSTRYYMACR